MLNEKIESVFPITAVFVLIFCHLFLLYQGSSGWTSWAFGVS